MITKQQWAKFCFDVHKARHSNLEPYIHGKRVIEVDIFKNEILTSIAGEAKTRYKFDPNINISLKNLYRSTRLHNVTLNNILQEGQQ